MAAETKTDIQAPTFFAGLKYRDARAAIEWLKEAFGFEVAAIYDGEDGSVAHAELRFGMGIVMVGPDRDNALGIRSPQVLGGVSQSLYSPLAADQIEELYERARAAGATVVRELADTDYGSRDFVVADPEGHLWCFGTYRPAG